MPKHLIKRYLPNRDELKQHKHLQMFGRLIHDPNLWHLNRRSAAGAFAVGLFAAFIPLPAQMAFAAAGAIAARVNLPISVALVWLTNPLTMPPLFYAAYTIGNWVLATPPQPVEFEMSADWLLSELSVVWEPFLIGNLILAAACSLAGYLLIRGLWRLHLIRHWYRRKKARALKHGAGAVG